MSDLADLGRAASNDGGRALDAFARPAEANTAPRPFPAIEVPAGQLVDPDAVKAALVEGLAALRPTRRGHDDVVTRWALGEDLTPDEADYVRRLCADPRTPAGWSDLLAQRSRIRRRRRAQARRDHAAGLHCPGCWS